MTAFAINSGGTVEWDSLSGGSVNATLDSYAVSNGSTLRIACDSYQCAGHSAAAGSLDSLVFSGTGGRLLIDGTAVRVLPFDTGSGTVPAIGTTVSRFGVSGPLLGVWANWQSEPLAAGAAMPAAGYIKLKTVSGGTFSAGALTGISASATGPDVVGWIEVRGADTASLTFSRLGGLEATGAWFDLGVTNGARGQVLPCPTTGTADGTFPGVWIETAAGSGVFDQWVGCGTKAADAATPTDIRAQMVWPTTAGIRIGFDGTNNVGLLPPAGCRVRIPNVLLTCCTRSAEEGSGPRVVPNANLATRTEFSTLAGASVSIALAVVSWYCYFVQPYSVLLADVAVADSVTLSRAASTADVRRLIVGPTQLQAQIPLIVSSLFAGGLFEDVFVARATGDVAGSAIASFTSTTGLTVKRLRSQFLKNRTVGTLTFLAQLLTDAVFEDLAVIGGSCSISTVSNMVIRRTRYADVFSGTTSSTLPTQVWATNTGGRALVLDGLDFFGLTNVHPYTSLLNPTNVNDVTVRNIGTLESPLNLGSVNATGVLTNASSANVRIRFQRVYTTAARSTTFSSDTAGALFSFDNVHTAYTGTAVLATVNSSARGLGFPGSTTPVSGQYGTHWVDAFVSATVGKIEIKCNEPTATSAAQCSITNGTPRFTSTGQVALTSVGDQVTWEMAYFALGHLSLANLAPTITGTNSSNVLIEFQHDTGSGYNGTWLTLNATNQNAVGAINPATGVRLKVRATCTTADAANRLTNIAVPTTTSAAAQTENLYPLDPITIRVENIVAGSQIKITRTDTDAVIENATVPGTTWSKDYDLPDATPIRIDLRKASGSAPYYQPWFTIGTVDSTTGFTTAALQVED